LWLKRADRLYWRDKKGATEMGKLDGKVAIVTGAGRGIGRAIAEAYVQEGAKVAITAAREQAELDYLAKQNGPERVLALLADVTNPEACEQVVDQTIHQFGHVDILVNNAGRGMKYVSTSFLIEPTRFWEVEPSVWRMIIDTNVNGPFYIARAVVTRLLEQRGGNWLALADRERARHRSSARPSCSEGGRAHPMTYLIRSLTEEEG
jgi:NAD(P)-dependent dehydrogenase (short-subunit alcohol dehydrogenase family)